MKTFIATVTLSYQDNIGPYINEDTIRALIKSELEMMAMNPKLVKMEVEVKGDGN